MGRNRKEWTKEEVNKAIQMYNSGFTYSDIGRELDRNRGSVGTKLKHLGVAVTKDINREYIYEVGEIVNETLKILKQIKMHRKCKNQNRTERGYLVESLVYSDAEAYEVQEHVLKRGIGCAYVSGRRVCEENSFWGIKRLRKNIIDVEEAKTLTSQSNKEIKVKCDSCNNTKVMRAQDLANQGFGCNKCDVGTSYPELFFLAYNEVLELGFVSEVRDLFKGYRFDFVNYENKTIVETHGRQHFEKGVHWGNKNSYEKTVKSDIAKRKWCKENGWTLIELDCRKSEFKFIQNSIKNSNLPNVEDKHINEMITIIENIKKYDVKGIINMYKNNKTIYQIAKVYNISHKTVANILNRNNVKMRIPGKYKR